MMDAFPHNYNSNLPAGWEEKVSQDGRAYYTDHKTQTTQWFHPITRKRKRVVAGLPHGWETVESGSGHVKYINRSKNISTHIDPRLSLILEEREYSKDMPQNEIPYVTMGSNVTNQNQIFYHQPMSQFPGTAVLNLLPPNSVPAGGGLGSFLSSSLPSRSVPYSGNEESSGSNNFTKYGPSSNDVQGPSPDSHSTPRHFPNHGDRHLPPNPNYKDSRLKTGYGTSLPKFESKLLDDFRSLSERGFRNSPSVQQRYIPGTDEKDRNSSSAQRRYIPGADEKDRDSSSAQRRYIPGADEKYRDSSSAQRRYIPGADEKDRDSSSAQRRYIPGADEKDRDSSSAQRRYFPGADEKDRDSSSALQRYIPGADEKDREIRETSQRSNLLSRFRPDFKEGEDFHGKGQSRISSDYKKFESGLGDVRSFPIERGYRNTPLKPNRLESFSQDSERDKIFSRNSDFKESGHNSERWDRLDDERDFSPDRKRRQLDDEAGAHRDWDRSFPPGRSMRPRSITPDRPSRDFYERSSTRLDNLSSQRSYSPYRPSEQVMDRPYGKSELFYRRDSLNDRRSYIKENSPDRRHHLTRCDFPNEQQRRYSNEMGQPKYNGPGNYNSEDEHYPSDRREVYPVGGSEEFGRSRSYNVNVDKEDFPDRMSRQHMEERFEKRLKGRRYSFAPAERDYRLPEHGFENERYKYSPPERLKNVDARERLFPDSTFDSPSASKSFPPGRAGRGLFPPCSDPGPGSSTNQRPGSTIQRFGDRPGQFSDPAYGGGNDGSNYFEDEIIHGDGSEVSRGGDSEESGEPADSEDSDNEIYGSDIEVETEDVKKNESGNVPDTGQESREGKQKGKKPKAKTWPKISGKEQPIIQKNIAFSVVPVGFPKFKSFSRADGLAVKNMIIDKINQLQPSDGVYPRFSGCEYRVGALLITCLDRYTANWLEEIVKDFVLSDGGKVCMKSSRVVRSSCIIGGHFPINSLQNEEHFFEALASENRDIDTSRWCLLQQVPVKNGLHLSIGTLRESLAKLHAVKYFLYYNNCPVKITVMTKKNSGKRPPRRMLRIAVENVAIGYS